MALLDDCISWWEMEETSGTRVDSHGSNDLTDVNTVGYDTGISGNAADLEKGNSETLSISDASQSGLEFSTSFSFSFWYKPESITAGDQLFSKGATSGTRSYQFNLFSSTVPAWATWNTSDASVQRGWTITALVPGNWYHFVLIHNLAGGSAELYVNGSSAGTQTGFATNMKDGSADFRIGSWGGNSNYLDGLIDEFAVWARALTSDEVAELYNSGSGISYAEAAGGGGGFAYSQAVIIA